MIKGLVFSLLMAMSLPMCAQTTHTFTFGPFPNGGAAMQTLDGQPANSATGYVGTISFPYNENPYWGIEVPQVWGFPNNGFLTNNTTTPPLGPTTFVDPNCNLQTNGCVDYQTGTAEFIGYGQGVSVSVTVFFTVHKHIGRYNHVYYTNDPTNGSGTATY